MGQAERNACLVETNTALKDALTRARQQCLHVEMIMKSLSTTLSTALGLPADQDQPELQASKPAVETSACSDPAPSSSLTTSHTIHESIERQQESLSDSGTSDMTGPNARASISAPMYEELFDVRNFMDYDLALPSLPESFSIHSQSKSPPSLDASQPGK